MTVAEIITYASSLGYQFEIWDAEEIIRTAYEGETVEEAVNDYLDAYER